MISTTRSSSGRDKRLVLRRNGLPSSAIDTDHRRLFYVFCLIALNCAAWVHSVAVVAVACTLGVLAVAVISSRELCVYLLYACLPVFNAMGRELGGTSLFYALIGIFLFKWVVNETVPVVRNRFLAFSFIVIVTSGSIGDPSAYARWLLLLAPLVVLAGSDLLRRTLSTAVFCCSLSLVISVIASYAMINRGTYPYTQGYVYLGEFTSTVRFAGLIGDSVVCAQLIVTVIAANVVLLGMREAKAQYVTFAISVFLALVCLATYSKTALLSMAIVAVVVLMLILSRVIRTKLSVQGVALLLFIASVFGIILRRAWNPESGFFLAMSARLQAQDYLTGRAAIWGGYTALWAEDGLKFLFGGLGIAGYNGFYSHLRFNRAHNIYIEAISCFGLIATLVMFFFLLFVISTRAKYGKGAVRFLPLLLLLGTGLVLHGLLEFPYFFEVIISLGLVEFGRKQDSPGPPIVGHSNPRD